MAFSYKIFKVFLSVFFIFTMFSFAQEYEIKLEDNYNYLARELKQSLNKTKDSLILECDYQMSKVVYLQNPYKEEFFIFSNYAKLPIGNLPTGRNLIEVFTNHKIIVLNIVKTKVDEKSEVKKNYTPITDLLNKKTLNPDTLITSSPTFKRKPIRMYWAIHTVDKNIGTFSTSELIDEKRKDYLIRKNKADLKSYTGSDNKLVIWEVYDVEQFMKFKRISNGFLVRSVGFNPEPIYISEK